MAVPGSSLGTEIWESSSQGKCRGPGSAGAPPGDTLHWRQRGSLSCFQAPRPAAAKHHLSTVARTSGLPSYVTGKGCAFCVPSSPRKPGLSSRECPGSGLYFPLLTSVIHLIYVVEEWQMLSVGLQGWPSLPQEGLVGTRG